MVVHGDGGGPGDDVSQRHFVKQPSCGGKEAAAGVEEEKAVGDEGVGVESSEKGFLVGDAAEAEVASVGTAFEDEAEKRRIGRDGLRLHEVENG